MLLFSGSLVLLLLSRQPLPLLAAVHHQTELLVVQFVVTRDVELGEGRSHLFAGQVRGKLLELLITKSFSLLRPGSK